jgi:hypothetical protein
MLFLLTTAGALSLPAAAQDVPASPLGLPEDWSNRHLIYSSAETIEDAIENGTVEQWNEKANDPRFIITLAKKEKLKSEKRVALITAKGKKQNKKQPPPSGPQIHRDWSNVMGGAAGVGASRLFPAKYNFNISTKSCASDFVVFTTVTAGATSSGTFYSTTGTFTAAPAAGGTVTITNALYTPAQVLTLTAVANGSGNIGLNFEVGADATAAATNLANAIARNGGTVGLTATSAAGVVTVTSVTTAVTAANITPAETLSNFTWGAETGGAGTKGQPTVFALNQLYADTTANGGCQTATQAVPATYWSYNTGTGASANTSPVLSLDGSQVAFTQTLSSVASLVLLKWKAGDGTIGVPVAPTSVAPGSYRACTAPCMTVMALNGSPDNTNSSPYVDYSNDIIYVGADNGTLHKFTGVFNGTPKEDVPIFDTTSTSAALNSTLYISVSASVAPNATESAVQTTVSAAQAGTYQFMTITQGAVNGNATTRTYTLRKNGGSTAITCTIPASQATCTDTTHTATFAAGDTIDVQMVRSSGTQNLTTTVHVQTGIFPALVGTTSILSSPVYDSASGLVFVGSNGPNATGNRLHSVNASTGAVVSSGTIGSASTVNGVRDAPIVDSSAQRVYAFIGADNSSSGAVRAAVYQFATNSSLATQNSGLGSKVNVGLSGNQNDLNRAMNAGAFDDAYFSSADPSNPSGSLYVCGSASGTARRATLWKVAISGNSLGAATEGPLLVSGDSNDGCSPVTVFKNGSTEHLFASVNVNGAALGGGGCTTPADGCVYMYQLPTAASFDTTSPGSTFDGITRYASVSTSVALNTTESNVATTLTAAQAGTYLGVTITQSANSPAGTTFTYTLRKNSGDTAVTCAIGAGAATCTDPTNTASYAAGDTIDVQVVRTSGTGTLTNRTLRVQLEAGASAGLNATGGTGGIVIDNTLAGGGSQVYYSTRTSPGIAVQASQAALQ